jgi:transcriptional regulator with XRE-family HTH domain
MSNSPDGGLGERLRRYRTDARLSQAELGRKAEVSAAYISELEAGAGRRPSGRVLLAIAQALDVTIAELLGREIGRTDEATEALPPGLSEFAALRNLPESDIRMLAGIRFRGEPPRTSKRWEVIYDTIRSSMVFDEDE